MRDLCFSKEDEFGKIETFKWKVKEDGSNTPSILANLIMCVGDEEHPLDLDEGIMIAFQLGTMTRTVLGEEEVTIDGDPG